ncbi:DNA repair protein rhp41 [Penicillium rolfsii]|nr:DNA repair protein rhp41 [Penicillium rolfsii]
MTRHSAARPARGRAARSRRPNLETPCEDQIPDVYQEMLEEAEARDPGQFHSDRPIKRRRLGDTKPSQTRAIPVDSPPLEQPTIAQSLEADVFQNVQTVYDSTTSSESDVEWEDVDVAQPAQGLFGTADTTKEKDETLQITLDRGPEFQKKAPQRRKPVTAAEKKVRLDAHKAHLLCLLAHVSLRNRWCNDDTIQRNLKRMLPRKIIALLNPDEDKPQFARSTTFIDGLNQAGDIFSRRFRVTKPGLKRAHWAEDQDQLKQRMESIMADGEIFFSKEDFQSQAKILQGSRDFGAQLFCALLRSAAVEARLVCSLQPLPFSGTVKDMTPSKKPSQYIIISSDDHETSTDEQQKSSSGPTTPSRTRRIGRPGFTSRPGPSSVRLGPQLVTRESSYPVFWVEAFNEAVQKWIPIDPLVTKSLAKPSKFEPPASDPYNNMNYVVAFEDDASARDVTRRYTKAFNAKTRKSRVEITRNGEKWWTDALIAYEKPFLEDRDEAEISELTSKSAAEPMPRNIQDFKDHPVYALERHLRRNEVIFPKRVIGHVGLSKTTSKSDNLETVYRRSDVHIVRSADKWYRLGRDVKVGEQPLKHVPVTRPKGGFASDEDDDEPEETPLYAEYQTEIYRPPPVVQGRIPKNAYGNLDVYVPSMVPPGAVHIKHPDAARSAKILGIDYADAVTGFEFRGRRGTAVFGGIVIAQEYQRALEEVLKSIADERCREEFEARAAEALRLWRLFLLKLRIAERVKVYADEDEKLDYTNESELSENDMDYDEEAGGGFIPEEGGQFVSGDAGGFFADHAGGFLPEENKAFAGDEGEGFVPEESGEGGGFIHDEPLEDPPAPVLEPPSTAQSSVTFQRNRPSKAPKAPRYELIIVPTKTEPGSEGLQQASPLEGSSAAAPIAVDSSANGGSKSASVDILSRPPSPVEATRPSPSPPAPDSDSEIEKGSLLSEDPEDEDAIPDWLI